MARRFQFSLRGLLGLVVAVCLLLGGWHLLETYGTDFNVSPLSVGKPFTLKGRYIHVFGPPQCVISVHVSNADPAYGWSQGFRVERSWLCCYDFNKDLHMMGTYEERPGDVTIAIGEVVRLPPGSDGYEMFTAGKSKTFSMSAD